MDKENEGESDSEYRTPRKDGKNSEKPNGEDSDSSTPLSARSENIMAAPDNDNKVSQDITTLFIDPNQEESVSPDVQKINEINNAKNALARVQDTEDSTLSEQLLNSPVVTDPVLKSDFNILQKIAQNKVTRSNVEVDDSQVTYDFLENYTAISELPVPNISAINLFKQETPSQRQTEETGTAEFTESTLAAEAATESTEDATENTEAPIATVEEATDTAEVGLSIPLSTSRSDFDTLLDEITEKFSNAIINDFVPIYNEQLELSTEPLPGIPQTPPGTPKKLSVLITEKYDTQFERDLRILQTTLLTRALGQHAASTESILPVGYTASLESLRKLPRDILHQLVEEIRRPELEQSVAECARRLSVEVQPETTCIWPDPNLLRETVAQLPPEFVDSTENLEQSPPTASSLESEYSYEEHVPRNPPTNRPLFGGIDDTPLRTLGPLRFDIYFEAYKLAKSVPREYLDQCMVQTFGRKVSKDEVREYFEKKKAHLAAQAAADPTSIAIAAAIPSAESEEQDSIAVRNFLDRISQETVALPSEELGPTSDKPVTPLKFQPSRATPTGEIEYLVERETTSIPELPVPRFSPTFECSPDNFDAREIPSHPYELVGKSEKSSPLKVEAIQPYEAASEPVRTTPEKSLPINVAQSPQETSSPTNAERSSSENNADLSSPLRTSPKRETPQPSPTPTSSYVNPDDIPIRPREENPKVHPLVTDFFTTCRGFPVEVIQQYCPGFYIPPPRSPSPEQKTPPKRGKKPARLSQGSPGSRLSQGSPGSRLSQGSPGSRLSQGSPGSRLSQGSPGSRLSQGSPGSRVSQSSPGLRLSQGSPESRLSKDCPQSPLSSGSLGPVETTASPNIGVSVETSLDRVESVETFLDTVESINPEYHESADNDQSEEVFQLAQEESIDDTVRAERYSGNTTSNSLLSLGGAVFVNSPNLGKLNETIGFDATTSFSYTTIELKGEEKVGEETITSLHDQLLNKSDLPSPTLLKDTNSTQKESSMYQEVADAMGDLIHREERFDKEAQNPQGDLDNKLALDAMMDRLSMAETDCERLKEQVADLKKELKSSRQKTAAVESEVATLKERETTLNALVEELKAQASATPDATATKEAEITELKAREEALMGALKEAQVLLKQNDSKLKELQQKEVKLADDLSNRTQSEVQISRVMNEYEKSISSLVAENEKMKKERDTAQMHLANIEMAFSDVHQKYERCKQIVQGYKDNESSFKQDIALNRDTIAKQEEKYEMLKAHAMAQLEKSNFELANMKKQYETELAKLTAQLKRFEIKNSSLQEALHQKTKECEQLSAVCDEFIGPV